MAPAIKGTNNVLTAAKELGVQRVVVTSSISAITPSRNWPADVIKNEDCWTDVEYCKQNGVSAFSLFLLFCLSAFIIIEYQHLNISGSLLNHLDTNIFETVKILRF